MGDVTVDLTHQKVDARDCPDCEEGLEGPVDVIRTHIQVTGPLTGDQEARLKEIAGRCPIHKTLRGRPQLFEDLHVRVPGE